MFSRLEEPVWLEGGGFRGDTGRIILETEEIEIGILESEANFVW